MPQNKHKILLVEDEDTLRQLYTEVMLEAGLLVDTASEGQLALQKMSQGGYDLVLLDMMLPKLTGIEIIETLHQTPPQKPNKKLVLTTNMTDPQLLKKFKKYHISDVIVKSEITPDLFINQVKQFLNIKE